MDLMERVQEFENRKMSSMSTSDRVSASREVKALILEVNEVYKQNKSTELMDIMKRLTVKKKKIEKRLLGRLPEMND
tara:strand:+ start:479 stop:709 length:231 start_codon:yes stop_codon:yes gene_type:complete